MLGNGVVWHESRHLERRKFRRSSFWPRRTLLEGFLLRNRPLMGFEKWQIFASYSEIIPRSNIIVNIKNKIIKKWSKKLTFGLFEFFIKLNIFMFKFILVSVFCVRIFTYLSKIFVEDSEKVYLYVYMAFIQFV